ncbi:DUF317 domain-containing protein [Actinoallomurus rhizosphaericola]|uniref:DUF317 domain-containing protein n=1 Tax=Actinoallomurus rhizosphaericola TaxID=2952536 RepID=UPI002092117A|nr:DUF317 domain-containing protein [Actinoallomurus rhizosphaericola]MCO5999761.1 DUF317 domain-containing protein [Actinoallomurus rhizosphaericola]
MALVSRPLAGPGLPGTALELVRAAGWTVTLDDKANAYAFAPDRRVILAFLPESNDFSPGGPLWGIRAYGDLHDLMWEATFTDNTPVEFITAFLTDLIKPEPLDTEREDEASCLIAFEGL